MDFLGIGTGEFILILILILILVGPKKLQEIARMMGKTTRVIRKIGSDFSVAIKQEIEESEKTESSSIENTSDVPSDQNGKLQK